MAKHRTHMNGRGAPQSTIANYWQNRDLSIGYGITWFDTI
jgi:hypothetical protein